MLLLFCSIKGVGVGRVYVGFLLCTLRCMLVLMSRDGKSTTVLYVNKFYCHRTSFLTGIEKCFFCSLHMQSAKRCKKNANEVELGIKITVTWTCICFAVSHFYGLPLLKALNRERMRSFTLQKEHLGCSIASRSSTPELPG